MIPIPIKQNIEDILGEKIERVSPCFGGDTSSSHRIETQEGRRLFVKWGREEKDRFLCESDGLSTLKKTETVSVPEVVGVDENFLILEWIESVPHSKKCWENAGKELALLHKQPYNFSGWHRDNYIGMAPQCNQTTPEERESWTLFFEKKRIEVQFRQAEKNGYMDSEMRRLKEKASLKIRELTNAVDEPMSLLHGDLWGGNYIETDQKIYLIDPAVYIGHRETDIAMTELFGGFPSLFYDAYNQTYPLSVEYPLRRPIYQLYHILNHLNLFGVSYYSQTISCLKKIATL